MKFTTVPVDVVGVSYEHRSLPVSAQRCVNFWPEAIPTGAKPKALVPFFGCKPFSTGTGLDRGIYTMSTGACYHVYGLTLYSVSSGGVQTSIGTILGTLPCIFADDGTNLIIVSPGNSAYQYNGTTLSQITDVDYEQGNSVAYINQQFVYDGTGARFQTSDAGDPDSINGLNYATKETRGDNITRVYTHNELVYLFGETSSIGTWYNSGTGNPPFDKITSSSINLGTASFLSVSSNKENVFFLGSDKVVYKMRSYQLTPVSPPAISALFQTYDTTNAIGACFSLSGQEFYIISFPYEDKTWCFNDTAQAPFELDYDGGRHLINTYTYAFGKHLVTDYRNGNIYELDPNTYTDNSTTVIRQRVTPPITSEFLGVEGVRIMMSRFQLIMETGTGIASGQGSNPVVMLEASYDGGKSYTNPRGVEIGRTGETVKVDFYNMCTAYQIIIRITISDPVKCVILSAAADIKLAGW